VLTGTPVLTEGRGSYTAAIYVHGQVDHICISNGRRSAVSLAMDRMPLFFDAAPGPDQLSDPSGFGGGAGAFRGSTNSGARTVSGLAGSDVSAVTFDFADGKTVEATVENGWYFAWWPGDSWPTSVQVTTSSGTLTSQVSGAACRSNATGCVFTGLNPNRHRAP
jgi:hypothetical protein